jgi:hypothetical protein
MKTNGIIKALILSLLIILLSTLPNTSHAQPDYDFRGAVLVSGTDLQIGAVYRFNNVKPGVDCFVTLADISAGITVSELDGASGYPEALQPTLIVQPFTKGYLEMNFQMLYAGTNNPYVQTEVPVTCIDVDGAINDGVLPVNEFDQIDLGGGYVNYQMMGGELLVTQSGNWFTGFNMATIDYPGRDTAAKQAMFTVVNANISDFTIRVGVDNKSSNSANRLRSVYFKKFIYQSALMPLYGLLSFSGVNKQGRTELNWQFAANNTFKNVTIERSTNGKDYVSIGNMSLEYLPVASSYNFTDNFSADGNVYYRLKITQPNYKFNYSNVLMMKGRSAAVKGFKIYPSLISADANINVDSEKKQQGSLAIADYSGRIVKQQPLSLQEGNNNIQLNNLDRLPAGNYIAIVRTIEGVYNQKITIR